MKRLTTISIDFILLGYLWLSSGTQQIVHAQANEDIFSSTSRECGYPGYTLDMEKIVEAAKGYPNPEILIVTPQEKHQTQQKIYTWNRQRKKPRLGMAPCFNCSDLYEACIVYKIFEGNIDDDVPPTFEPTPGPMPGPTPEPIPEPPEVGCDYQGVAINFRKADGLAPDQKEPQLASDYRSGRSRGGNPTGRGATGKPFVSIRKKKFVIPVGQQSEVVEAQGGPAHKDIVWVFSSANSSVADFIDSGKERCGGSTSCYSALTGKSKGETKAIVTMKCKTSPYVQKQAKADVNVVEMKLTEVHWKGNGQHKMMKKGQKWIDDMLSEEGNTFIKNPVWRDNDVDGTPDKEDPVAYTKGSRAILTQAKLQTSPRLKLTSKVPAKLKVEVVTVPPLTSCQWSASKTTEVTLSGDGVAVKGTLLEVPIADKVDNCTLNLMWSLSVDDGPFKKLATSKHQFFITYGTPEGFFQISPDGFSEDKAKELYSPMEGYLQKAFSPDQGVTARRLDEVTMRTRNKKTPVEIAQQMRHSLKVRFGGRSLIPVGNHWTLLEPAEPSEGCDCLSLSILTVKMLRMIGVKANALAAYATRDFDASRQELATLGKDVALGFEAGGYNAYEGFFFIKSDGGEPRGAGLLGFTVVPRIGPILADDFSSLRFNIIRATLLEERKHGGNRGKQFWWFIKEKSDDGTLKKAGKKASDEPKPFPGLD